ncbi:hypothetical protein AYO20_08333 [Fonsecaea nubica]|uniref:Lactam utilization protein lamB n=1 Tax=Fonsecaea nubica TaxID=856822 RepID=A0A178CN81_9EURO|nr:hypothetical protein AYO20_08333 [Fonsecaea nubica]OAL31278.1 hypothetical protein AYO20_08333 [Fonsecaea nubica]
MSRIKHKAMINVDLGEGYGNWSCGPDAERLLPLIDHANIACGFHASDPLIMMDTVEQCKAHGVKVGAHPGFPDLQGFGRREMKLSHEELTAMTIYQVGALKGFLDRAGVPLHHVKPHGMLYGVCCRDYDVAKAVFRGIPEGVPVFGLAGTCMEQAARDMGIDFIAEFYADVKYNTDGSLIIDRKKGAWDREEISRRVSQQLETCSVGAIDGSSCDLRINDYRTSICCHSDSPGCVEIVEETRKVVDAFNKKYFPGG